MPLPCDSIIQVYTIIIMFALNIDTLTQCLNYTTVNVHNKLRLYSGNVWPTVYSQINSTWRNGFWVLTFCLSFEIKFFWSKVLVLLKVISTKMMKHNSKAAIQLDTSFTHYILWLKTVKTKRNGSSSQRPKGSNLQLTPFLSRVSVWKVAFIPFLLPFRFWRRNAWLLCWQKLIFYWLDRHLWSAEQE